MPQAVLQEDGVRVSLPHVPAPDLGDGTDGKTGPNLEKAVGAHFNGPGHKVSDMSMTILQKVWNKDPMFLAVREDFWINKMNSKHKGMNRNKGS